MPVSTGITDERGIRLSTYRYDYRGRPVESSLAEGAGRIQVEYGNEVRRVTDARGTTRIYRYKTTQEIPRLIGVGQSCSGGCSDGSTKSIAYDSRGYLLATIDFKDNQTNYQHKSRGPQESITRAVDQPEETTTTTQWHPIWRLPVRITEPGRITTQTIDADKGLVRSRTITDTSTNENRTTTWTYNDYGQVKTVDGLLLVWQYPA